MHHIVTAPRILYQYAFLDRHLHIILKHKKLKYTRWTGPYPVRHLFCYLTYGSRTANQTNSLDQTVMGLLGTLTGENPLLLFPAIF